MTATSPTATNEAAARPSSRRFIPLFIAIALAVLYGGYRIYLARKPFEWSGTVEAKTITIGSRTGGRVKDVLVREGDRVTPQQPLVVLEPGDLDAQRLMAKAQLEQTEANLEKVKRGARPEEIEQAKARAQTAAAALQEQRSGARPETIDAAEARLVAAQATLDKATTDAARAHQLFASGAIAQAEVDAADTALKGATAQRDAAKHQLDELKNGSRREDIAQAAARALEAQAQSKLVQAGSRVEDIKAAEASVLSAKGRLDQIQVMIDELVIKAPRAARVEALDLRPGDIVAPNGAAATLLEEDQLYVRIYVPETQIGKLNVGDEVPVSVDSFPNRTFKGKVEHINAVGEYSPRNLQTADERADQVFATRVGLSEGRDVLKAGMAAFITVPKR